MKVIIQYPQMKHFNTQHCWQQETFEFMHYNVKTDGQQVWFSSGQKFNNLCELVDFCMQNKADGLATRLANICLIQSPHKDATFEFQIKERNSFRIPWSELELGIVS